MLSKAGILCPLRNSIQHGADRTAAAPAAAFPAVTHRQAEPHDLAELRLRAAIRAPARRRADQGGAGGRLPGRAARPGRAAAARDDRRTA
jgi:hypothetical protein